jgi:small subunit ribosomal protein S1
VVEAPVTSLTKFGAFVQLAEGVEGMIHIGDISVEPGKGKAASGAEGPRQRSMERMERSDMPNMERRINHPQDVLKVGQVVRAQVLEVDTGKRRLRLGMKQLVPTSVDEYIAEHKDGDVVTGRMTEVASGRARVELGEGIHAVCKLTADTLEKEEKPAQSKTDLSSLTSLLEAKWKGGQATGAPRREPVRAGQIRSFRIVRLDAAGKKIELELA